MMRRPCSGDGSGRDRHCFRVPAVMSLRRPGPLDSASAADRGQLAPRAAVASRGPGSIGSVLRGERKLARGNHDRWWAAALAIPDERIPRLAGVTLCGRVAPPARGGGRNARSVSVMPPRVLTVPGFGVAGRGCGERCRGVVEFLLGWNGSADPRSARPWRRRLKFTPSRLRQGRSAEGVNR